MAIRPLPRLPLFVQAGGFEQAMQLPPPFDFDNVSIHAFPLRARLHALQRFCDGYVNVIPREAGYFHAFMPYVFMFVVNYGRMAVEEAKLGWLSQNEIVFAIPVEWYIRKNGQVVFKDWGLLTPFIFIDNPLSITTGRMVYGWSKSLGQLTPEVSTWMDRPQDPLRLLSFSGPTFLDANNESEQTNKVIFEISVDARGVVIGSSRSLLSSATSMGRDLADMLTELWLTQTSPGTSLDNWMARLQRFARKLDPRDPKVQFSSINLKQFRDSNKAGYACYQGVTAAPMVLRRINAIGPLGRDVLRDPSRGFRVRVHRYETYPIIESLGLEVEQQRRGRDADVAQLKPVFPFWVDMDLRYERGETIAWCTKRSEWFGRYGERLPPPPQVQRGVHESSPRYNSVAMSTREILGPFEMPNTTLRVLPLLARREKLQEHCDEYLNRPLLGKELDGQPLEEWERTFDVWGRYVYLVIANHKAMVCETDNIGWWADRDVTFYVPVKWYERHGKDRRLRSLALVPVFSYANSETAAITGAEVSGIPMMMANVNSGRSAWMSESGPAKATRQEFVEVKTTMFQVLGEGAKAQEHVLLKVRSELLYPYNDDVEWRRIASTWGRELKGELKRKAKCAKDHEHEFEAARLLAVQALAERMPINILTLRQFRECEEPRFACYQSLNLIRRYIKHVYDMSEIEGRLYVSIYSYQSQPIVDKLGLIEATTRSDGDVIEHVLQPVRPFWMRLGMREENAVVIKQRAGDIAWQEGLEAPGGKLEYYFSKEMCESTVNDKGLDDKIKKILEFTHEYPQQIYATDLPESKRQELEKYWQDLKECLRALKKLQADAVEEIEPQLIIEPALSEEWLDWGDPRRLQTPPLPPKPPFCIPGWTLEGSARKSELGENFKAEDWYTPSTGARRQR